MLQNVFRICVQCVRLFKGTFKEKCLIFLLSHLQTFIFILVSKAKQESSQRRLYENLAQTRYSKRIAYLFKSY